MNEQIQELAFQASENYGYHPEFAKKFAELIVQECLLKINGAKIRNESYAELVERIKEDFGVE